VRDSYFEATDTLRPGRLPAFRTELNHRPGYGFVVANKQRLIRSLLAASLPALVAMAAFRLVILVADFGFRTSLAALIVLAITGLLIYEMPSLRVILAGLKFAFAAWLVLIFLEATLSPGTRFTLVFLPAVGLCGWTANRNAAYAIQWMSGNPLLKPEARPVVDRLLQNVNAKHHLSTGLGIVIAILIVHWLSSTLSSELPVRSAILTVLLYVVSIACLCLACIRQTNAIRRGTDALSIWFGYREHSTAPGQLSVRIPVLSLRLAKVRLTSTASTRRRLPLLALFVLGIWTLTACAFCPVMALSSDRWKFIAENDPDEADNIQESDVFSEMTENQETTFHALSETEQEEYLQALRTLQTDSAARKLRGEHIRVVTAQLNSRMDAWVAASIQGFAPDHSFNFWMLATAGFCCVTLPPLLFVSAFCLVYGPLLQDAYSQLENQASGNHFSTDEWSRYVTRIQHSKDKTERESLWIGQHADAGYPVLLHREILHEHAHILGDSGSGKSALGLAPLMSQLISASGRDHRQFVEMERPKRMRKDLSSIVVIDLKGDPALFHGARIDAQKAGLPFRWFTNQTELATHVFNPFLQKHMTGVTPNQQAEILLDSLGLSHGDGYGRSYYSRVNRRILSRILTTFGSRIDSFAKLHEYTQDEKLDLLGKKLRISKKEREDAAEVFAAIESLAAVTALNVTPESRMGDDPALKHRIDMHDVCARPMVVYFYLPAAIEAASVKEIGQLALFSLLSAAVHREAKGLPNLQTYLFIDEFQQIVSENLEIVLRQARSKRIAAILANQTISDLITPTADLRPTVQGNTRFKQFFAATDLEQQKSLIEASGDTIDYLESWTLDGTGIKDGEIRQSQTVVPRLSRNDVISISDKPTQSIVQISRGKGFAQFGGFPFALQSQFHVSEDEYDRRGTMTWPRHESELGTILPSVKPEPIQEPEPARTIPSAAPPESASSLAKAINALAADQALPPERNEKDA